MRIGFIGAGKAGCSLGKYFAEYGSGIGLEVTGYASLHEEAAKWAAEFTGSRCFCTPEEVIAASDTIILSTSDGAIKKVWNSIQKNNVKEKVICHLSGSLSSDVFSGIEEYGGFPASVHPMFAFSSKESVYQQLHQVCFTLEGHPVAVSRWKELLSMLGNDCMEIPKEEKPRYHAAASMLSNQVIAVLSVGYELLQQCGFSDTEARHFSEALVRDNVEHVLTDGCVEALTGPVERGDKETIEKHLTQLTPEQEAIYRSCGRQLITLAQKKNPERDYSEIRRLL